MRVPAPATENQATEPHGHTLMNNKLLLTVAIVAALGAFAWVNNLPKHTQASTSPLDQYALYGIDAASGELIRYAFAIDDLSIVGPITLGSSTVLTGIQGSAHIPKHINILSFWTDPEDRQAKLVKINSQDATATLVSDQTLGTGTVTAAAAAHDPATDEYTLYAVQQADPVDFEIDGGDVIPGETFAAKITVLGAAITAGGAYDMPVTVQVNIGGTALQPFGTASLALDGNVNDGANPRVFVPMSTYDADLPVSVTATSWEKIDGQDGDQNSEWQTNMTVNSHTGSAQVLTLRDGDSVPAIDGFMDQDSLETYIADYLDTDTQTVSLSPNQAIYLFELGTTDLSSSAADFQDLVVLVTLARDTAELIGQGDTDVFITGTVAINPNNSPNAEFTLTKDDGSTVTRDDLHEGTIVTSEGVFYEGPASYVHVKPKGPGSQNTLIVNGVPYAMKNANAYEFNAPTLTVKVYNDTVSDGTPMGRWHVQMSTTESTVADESAGTPIRLITVDQQTGVADQVMLLQHPYDSLAAGAAGKLYATYGQSLYLIDPIAGTETPVGDTEFTNTTAMETADTDLLSFTTTANKLVHINAADALTNGATTDLAVDDLASFILMHLDDEPSLDAASYD